LAHVLIPETEGCVTGLVDPLQLYLENLRLKPVVQQPQVRVAQQRIRRLLLLTFAEGAHAAESIQLLSFGRHRKIDPRRRHAGDGSPVRGRAALRCARCHDAVRGGPGARRAGRPGQRLRLRRLEALQLLH
jgi:hypothetical protein